MNFENLGDRIIDDQGNVKTIASAQDARLYYLDFEGNRKKYLLEGEAAGGEGGEDGNNTGRIFSDPKFLYLNSYEKVSSDTKQGYYTGVLGDNPPAYTVQISPSYNAAPQECFFDMTLTYSAGDDFELTPNDKLDMVIGSTTSITNQIITCELYVDSILIRKGQIGLSEGFRNTYSIVNSFNLIKLNEIVDVKTISGNCSLEIKIKYYNGLSYEARPTVTLNQIPKKIFTEDEFTAPCYYGLAKNLYLENYYCYAKGLDNILFNLECQIADLPITQRIGFAGGSFDNSLSENYVFFMEPGRYTSSLNIYGFSNNSMIIFNTDPDNDFQYSFSIENWWKINKPFDFQKGKSYVIACEGYCIFWCEVQNYE